MLHWFVSVRTFSLSRLLIPLSTSHIDWHLDLGLGVVLAEDTTHAAALQGSTPADWDALCPAYNALDPSMMAVQIVPTPIIPLLTDILAAPTADVADVSDDLDDGGEL